MIQHKQLIVPKCFCTSSNKRCALRTRECVCACVRLFVVVLLLFFFFFFLLLFVFCSFFFFFFFVARQENGITMQVYTVRPNAFVTTGYFLVFFCCFFA